jgi:hypothetical protein
LDWAISLIISCTTILSWFPHSLGFISIWKALEIVVTVREVVLLGILIVLCSDLTFSTRSPILSEIKIC